MMNFSISHKRHTAKALIIVLVAQLLAPYQAFALTSGPSQPEFSSFEPVSTTQMVNEFTGDFTYNLPVIEIPGPEGSGYAMSLSYHSGTTPEEEASWVGYGWTLNPGAINRSKRGFPDDYKSKEVKFHNDVPANWTASVGGYLGDLEVFGYDEFNASLNASLRYNNEMGYSYTAGVGFSVRGIVSFGYSLYNGKGSFSFSVNPAKILLKKAHKLVSDETIKKINEKSKTNDVSRGGIESVYKNAQGSAGLSFVGSNYGLLSKNWSLRATKSSPYNGQSVNVTGAIEANPASIPAGASVGMTGSFTRQKNVPLEDKEVCGFLYSGDADGGIMDYYSEKEAPFTKRDKYLAIPFSNADEFSVSGEGLGGGFRAYSKRSGHFYPDPVKSHTDIGNIGLEFQSGGDIGMGSDLGFGWHNLETQAWKPQNSDHEFSSIGSVDTDEPYFFRFKNDLGGNFDFGSINPEAATLDSDKKPVIPGSTTPLAQFDGYNPTQLAGRTGRASYIGFHTNAEMALSIPSTDGSPIYYKSYNKDVTTRNFVDRSSIVEEGIGEFVTTNEDGMTYNFGLPVYSCNERNLAYDFKKIESVKDNYIAFADEDNESNIRAKVGEERPTAYATTYLLTSITSPDFIDRNLDGPDDQDFGAWTKFNYQRIYGSDVKNGGSDWYHWRLPYEGFYYDRGELSNQKDDMCSFMSGDKEIYYLQTIETRTHKAIFITSDRVEGLAARPDNDAGIEGANSLNALKRLDKIELYAKDLVNNTLKLLQTVHFKYRNNFNGVMPNQPNSIGGILGKLTLEKVYTEYEGIVNARISPYEFEYEYPNITYPTPYGNLDDHISALTSGDQNPDYLEHNLDPWGAYQANGVSRFNEFQNWVDQAPPPNFDPAAWQLKAITLPSGGKILIQYEQDEYVYVQDRRAMAMVSLRTDPSTFDILDVDLGNKFYLNTEDIGISTTPSAALDTLKDIIQKEIIDKEEKIFFKFLYSLSLPAKPSLASCDAEYIEGFVKVNEVGVDNDGVGLDGLYIKVGTLVDANPWDEFAHPRQICVDFVRTNRMGMLNPTGDCSVEAVALDENKGPEKAVLQLLSFYGSAITHANTSCASMDETRSYLRIPLSRPKKGGGIRVKRLLMYDNGMPGGEPVLYGNEYIYETFDPLLMRKTSSGVAVNEPAKMKDECALTTQLQKRKEQKWTEKIIAGVDLEQFRGPVGETLLPAASVGYSRVIIKNIHSGKTNPGFTVKEFLTAKDYPFDRWSHPWLLQGGVEMTDIQELEKDWLVIPAGLFTYSKSNLWLSQGYSFILNDFHGKPKSTATYTGDCAYLFDPAKVTLTSLERYEYFEVGEKIPIAHGVDMSAITLEYPGKEMEVVMESRTTEDIAHDYNIEGDLSAGIFGPIPVPFVTAIPSGSYSESKLFTSVVSKVTMYPSIVKRTVSFQDGIWTSTINRAFSQENGRPILTQTTDGFNELDLQQSTDHVGIYTSYQFPATDMYPALRQKAYNSRKGFYAVTLNNSGDYNIQCSSTSDAAFFQPGDLIAVRHTSGTPKLFHVKSVTAANVELYELSTNNQSIAIGTVNVEILESGRANRLNENTGNLVVYGNEINVQTVTVPNIPDRQAFVDFLNQSLQIGYGSSAYISYPYELGMYMFEAPSGDPVVPCSHCDSLGVNIIEETNVSGLIYHLMRVKCLIPPNNEYFCDMKLPRSAQPHLDHFELSMDGNLQYYLNGGELWDDLSLCKFCSDSTTFQTIAGVLDVNISDYSDNWVLPTAMKEQYCINPSQNYSPYEIGERGKFRPNAQYVYREEAIPGVDKSALANDYRVYKDAGVFKEFVLFDWLSLANNDPEKWLKVNQTNLYSPYGQVLEEEDIRGVKSAAKYGYSHNLPYAITQNSDFQSIHFESFENQYSDCYGGTGLNWEDGLPVSTIEGIIANEGHAGKQSYFLKLHKNSSTGDYESTFTGKPITITQQMGNQGLIVKMWTKTRNIRFNSIKEAGIVMLGGSLPLTLCDQLARMGDWTLYEAKIPATALSAYIGSTLTPQAKFIFHWSLLDKYEVGFNILPYDELWLDDWRVQPADAQMVCYVYDPATYRLMTSFDDQHFGLFYQYNAEGKLVRKMVETERGMKTVQETQYHIPPK